MTEPIKVSEKFVYPIGLAAGMSWHTTEDRRSPGGQETLSTHGFDIRAAYGIGYDLSAESRYEQRNWLLNAERAGAVRRICGFAEQYCGGGNEARVVGIEGWSHASIEGDSNAVSVGGSILFGNRRLNVSAGGGYQYFDDDDRPDHPVITGRVGTLLPMNLSLFIPLTVGLEVATDPTDGFFKHNYSTLLTFSFVSAW